MFRFNVKIIRRPAVYSEEHNAVLDLQPPFAPPPRAHLKKKADGSPRTFIAR
jgi:hypothetical protein